MDISTYSDHVPCLLTVLPKMPISSSEINTSINLNRNKTNLDIFESIISTSDPAFDLNKNSDITCYKFIETIANFISEAGLLKQKRIKPIYNKPWFNRRCHQARKKVRQLFRKCKNNSFDQAYLTPYLSLKSQFKNLLHQCKTNYLE